MPLFHTVGATPRNQTVSFRFASSLTGVDPIIPNPLHDFEIGIALWLTVAKWWWSSSENSPSFWNKTCFFRCFRSWFAFLMTRMCRPIAKHTFKQTKNTVSFGSYGYHCEILLTPRSSRTAGEPLGKSCRLHWYIISNPRGSNGAENSCECVD